MDTVELDIVANQIVEQIVEAEKNVQESARASTPLSMALKPLRGSVVLRDDTEVTQVDKRAASLVPTNTRRKCNGRRMFSTTDLVYLSLHFKLFIHFPAFSHAACVKRAPIKLKYRMYFCTFSCNVSQRSKSGL